MPKTLALSLSLLVCTMLALLTGGTVLADDPQAIQVQPLAAIEVPQTVQVRAFILEAALSCEPNCQLHVEQTVQLNNSNRSAAAHVRIGLPIAAGAGTSGAPVLRDTQGRSLTSSGPAAGWAATWDVELAAGARRTLIYTSTIPLGDTHYMHLRALLSRLSSWRAIESARFELAFPAPWTDDVFPRREPPNLRVDGSHIIWEYENPRNLVDHEIYAISPRTWQTLNSLRASRAHRELAALYQAMDAESARRGLGLRDHVSEILGELHLALERNTEDLAARSNLVQIYQAQAQANPEQRVNYLVLAAEELREILKRRPQDTGIANTLARTYYEAAVQASNEGNLAVALDYLARSAQASGTQATLDSSSREQLALQWAVGLAEQGLAGNALIKLNGLLSPQLVGSLLHYAPPLISARTEVLLQPSERVVRYTFRPYPPTREGLKSQLQQIGSRLAMLDGCQTSVEQRDDLFLLEIRVPYQSIARLKQVSAALAQTAMADSDLIAALVAAPWQTQLRSFAREHEFARERYTYYEDIDLLPVKAAWQARSELVDWRTIEVRDAKPTTEQGQLEQRLTLLTLREQRQVWDQITVGSYWTYRIAHSSETTERDAASWLVGWGQKRTLQHSFVLYDWMMIRRMAIWGGAILALALVILIFSGRTRPA